MPYHLAFKSKVISKLVKEIVKWMKLTNSAFLVFEHVMSIVRYLSFSPFFERRCGRPFFKAIFNRIRV